MRSPPSSFALISSEKKMREENLNILLTMLTESFERSSKKSWLLEMVKEKYQEDWGSLQNRTLLLSIFDVEMDCKWKNVRLISFKFSHLRFQNALKQTMISSSSVDSLVF